MGIPIGTVVEGEGSVEEEMEQQAMGHYEVAFKGSENRYTLFVFGSTQLVNQAVEALGQILPWMLFTVFGISLVISLFYSRYLSKPIRKLGVASDKMAGPGFFCANGNGNGQMSLGHFPGVWIQWHRIWIRR